MHQIFVYGTLLKGMYNYEIYCSAEHSYRRKAYVDGLLYSLKERRYPALLKGKKELPGRSTKYLRRRQGRWITGELFRGRTSRK